MEYFRLTQDKRMPYSVLIQSLMKIQNIGLAKMGDIIPLKKVNVVFVNEGSFNYFPDVLDSQRVFMIQDNVQKVFSMFLEQPIYRDFCLLDRVADKCVYYLAPQLEIIDCLSKKTDCNLDRSVFHNIVLKEKALVGKDIFRVGNVNDTLIIVSLAVAESLLRRNVKGIRLLHVSVDNEQEDTYV